MSTFKVGDRVVVVYSAECTNPFYRWIGFETTIIEVPPLEKNILSKSDRDKDFYALDSRGLGMAGFFVAFGSMLRKVDDPPMERPELGEWELLPWNPYKNKETV